MGKLTILTPYPKVLTDEFRRAFERHYPLVDVDIVKKKTGTGIRYLRETAKRNETDLFWVSAPDAMELLKGYDLLAPYKPELRGIPAFVAGYPVSDPDGLYTGFAASGYGIMSNFRYLSAVGIKIPKQWEDLTGPEFFNHVGMSSPSRSGTTHLTVESILQGKGWDEGWALIKRIAGNLKQVTKKSHDVPRGIEKGGVGTGIVIDYYGLGSKARRNPVDFSYPVVTSVVPANIAVIKHAPNPRAAEKFIDFLLSDEGQTLLLAKENSRLPLRPEVYKRAPEGYPNPFTDPALKNKKKFDVKLSKSRYNLVNALFDNMVTFNFNALKKATRAVQEAEAMASSTPDRESAEMIAAARKLLEHVVIPEYRSRDKRFAGMFQKKRKKITDKIPPEQAAIEAQWDEGIKQDYAQALELATAAKKRLGELQRQQK